MFYFLQEYRNTSQDQCLVSPTFCRNIDPKSYFMLDYRYISQDHCIVSPTFCKNIDTLVETSVS